MNMNTRIAPFLKLIVLPGLLLMAPVTRLPAAAGYTLTKLIDNTTPIPDETGTYFTYFNNGSNDVYLTDGTTAVFMNQEFPPGSDGGGTPSDTAVWSISTSGGTPVRIVDTNTLAPGGNGMAFNNVAPVGVGGGMVVFLGSYSIAGSFTGGGGLYAVPVGGGAITTLVDQTTALPSNSRPFNGTAAGGVAVHGSQVLFTSAGGIYFVPVTGGAVTRFGDGSTPLEDPAGTMFSPTGTEDDGEEADFGGGIVTFLPSSNDFSAVFAGPATGLTLGSNNLVNNATFIADAITAIPGGSGNFDQQLFSVYTDDSGTPVFYGQPYIGGPGGLYAFVNGAVAVLADTHTTVSGQTSPLGFVTEVGEAAVGGGAAYFYGGYTDSSGNAVNGIFTVPVVGGTVTTVVDSNDTIPGLPSGDDFSTPQITYGGVGAGKIVFSGGFYDPQTSTDIFGIYLATPGGGGSSGTTNMLTLSNRTGGNTGPVTVTATLVSGASLVSGATVTLEASGQPNIAGGAATVDASGTSLTSIIDLSGKALGTYDFVITNPDGTTITQPASFTIEAATGPQVYSDFLGRFFLRAGKAQPYVILVGNSGDTDAASVPVFVSYPNYFTCQLTSPLVALPPPTGANSGFDLTQMPLTYTNGSTQDVLPLIVPHIPAHGIVFLQVLFTVPDVPMYAHNAFEVDVSTGEPLLDAETGMPATGETADSAAADGEHIDSGSAGTGVTCAASIFNTIIDCLSTVSPQLKLLTCAPGLILAAENGYLGTQSDSATDVNSAIAYGQAGAGAGLAIANCIAQKLGTSIVPGFGNVVNGIQCALDLYLLYTNCIKPPFRFPGQDIVSGDPNDLDGSVGDGSASHYLTGAQPLRYIVSFENEDTASAPAQSVTITNPLDANIDLSTFSLGPIAFGATLLNPPAGSQSYTATVDLRPTTDLLVKVTAALNTSSRMLTYSFQSLDPSTNEPPTDPTVGFLPPDVNAPEGDGFVIYYANSVAGAATGTAINDQASIVFDVNAAIATPTWTNTIDNAAPVSKISALPKKEKVAQIPLHLISSDVGSGVSYYNIYASEDGGAFQALVKNTAGPTITFTGVTGHSYAFFSQAVDGAGNVEPLKTAAEASTKIRGADLIGGWKGEVNETTTASGRVKLTGKLKITNQSPLTATSAGSIVRFYLSADGTFAASDPVVGKDVPFDALAAGADVKLPIKLKLPAGTAASGMYLIAVIDPEKTVPEADTTNNTIVYGPLP